MNNEGQEIYIENYASTRNENEEKINIKMINPYYINQIDREY